MGKLSGAILIVAGVAVATYTLSAREPAGPESAAPAARAGAEVSAKPGTANPPEGHAKAAGAATEKPQPAPSPPPPPVAKSPEPKPNPQPVTGKVVPPPGPLNVAEAPPRVPVDHSKAADAPPLDKDGLTREIQRQLKRAGCYGGAITGVWSPAVRQAMKAFTDRVNAALPVEQPDQVLLALVQNHKQATCAACPAGQAAGGDGRCLPTALLARAKKSNAGTKEAAPTKVRSPGQTGDPTTGTAAAPPTGPPPTGRMSLAGPPPAAIPPDRIKRAPSYRNNARRHAPAARPPPYAEARSRDRRRADRAPSGAPTGWPWWAVPLFSP